MYKRLSVYVANGSENSNNCHESQMVYFSVDRTSNWLLSNNQLAAVSNKLA